MIFISFLYLVCCFIRLFCLQVVACGDKPSWGHKIRYLSLHDNSDLAYFSGHTKQVIGLETCPGEDIFFSSSLDETVRFWDLRSPKCQGLIRTGGRAVIAVDPMGVVLALCTGSSVSLFDRACCDRGPFVQLPLPEPLMVHSMHFSPDGARLAVVGVPLYLYAPDFQTGSLRYSPVSHSSSRAPIAGGPQESENSAKLFLLDTFRDPNECVIGNANISLSRSAQPRIRPHNEEFFPLNKEGVNQSPSSSSSATTNTSINSAPSFSSLTSHSSRASTTVSSSLSSTSPYYSSSISSLNISDSSQFANSSSISPSNTTLSKVPEDFVSLSFAPDGRSIAVGAQSGHILSFDALPDLGSIDANTQESENIIDPKGSGEGRELDLLAIWEHGSANAARGPISALCWNPSLALAVSATEYETAWWIPQR